MTAYFFFLDKGSETLELISSNSSSLIRLYYWSVWIREDTVSRGTVTPDNDLHKTVSLRHLRSLVSMCNCFRNAVSFENVYGKQYATYI